MGLVGHEGLGGEEQGRDRGCILQRGAGHLGRIDDAGLEQVDHLAGGGVEAGGTGLGLDLLDDDGAFESGVVGDEPCRGLEGSVHGAGAGGLVTFERVDGGLERCTRTEKGGAATSDDAFLDGCTSGAERVLDAVLLLLELHLGGGADLDDRNATRQLRETLLELLTIPVGIGVLDLALDLGHTTVDVGGFAGALDDGGLVLGHHDLAGGAEQVEGGRVELEADLLADDLTTGEDGHVGQHRLAALTEARGLDGHRVERATDLVHDKGGERFTVDVLGDDEEGLTRLHDLLEDGEHVLHRGDLRVHEEDVRVVEDGFLTLEVGDEVRRQVALVELHALDEVEIHAEGVGLLNGDHAVLADLVDGIGDDATDDGVGGRDAGDLGDLGLVVDLLGLRVDAVHGRGNGLLDAALEAEGAGTGSHVAQTFTHEGLRQHGGGGGAVTGDVVGLGRNFLDQLRTHVLERIVEFDLTSDGHAIVGDGGCTELLVEDHVATLRAEGDLDGVGQCIHTGLEGTACVLVELEHLCHVSVSDHLMTARTSRALRMRTSLPSTVISVPPYLEYTTVSPVFTSTGMSSPVCSLRRPGPTARTSPCWGFSLAVSGMTRPLAVVASLCPGRTTMRSSRG